MTDEQEGSIGFWVRLGNRVASKIESYEQHLTDISAAIRRYDHMNMRPITQAGQLSASGFGLIDIGRAPTGFSWVVRCVSISDAALWTNSMGAAIAQVGVGEVELIPNLPMANPMIRWAFSALPNVATFGTNHFWVGPTDSLFIQVQNGNANQNVQATAVVEEWPVTKKIARSAG